MFDYVTFYFNSRYKAEDKLLQMHDIADDYGLITVADYYEICSPELNYDFICNKYGWLKQHIESAHVTRHENGAWIIDLPKPLPIDSATGNTTSKASCRSNRPLSRDTLNITVNTSELKDPNAAIAGIFKMIPLVKDRVINISIW